MEIHKTKFMGKGSRTIFEAARDIVRRENFTFKTKVMSNKTNRQFMTEPIDQATKDLIEKEAYDSKLKKFNTTDEKLDKMTDPERVGIIVGWELGYIQAATVWAEKLKQERNKVIDECIAKLSSTTQVRRLLESLKTP